MEKLDYDNVDKTEFTSWVYFTRQRIYIDFKQ